MNVFARNVRTRVARAVRTGSAATVAVLVTSVLSVVGGPAAVTEPALAASTAPWITVKVPGVEVVGYRSGIKIRSNKVIAKWRIDFSRAVKKPGVGKVTTLRGAGAPPYAVVVSWLSTNKVTLHTTVTLKSGKVMRKDRSVYPITYTQLIDTGGFVSSDTTSGGSGGTTTVITTGVWDSTKYPTATYSRFVDATGSSSGHQNIVLEGNVEGDYWRSADDGILRTTGQVKKVLFGGVAPISSTTTPSDVLQFAAQATIELMPADDPNSAERQSLCLWVQVTMTADEFWTLFPEYRPLIYS